MNIDSGANVAIIILTAKLFQSYRSKYFYPLIFYYQTTGQQRAIYVSWGMGIRCY